MDSARQAKVFRFVYRLGLLALILVQLFGVNLAHHSQEAQAGGSSDVLFIPDSDIWVISNQEAYDLFLILEPYVLHVVWEGVLKHGLQYVSSGGVRFLIYWDDESYSLVGLDSVSRKYWVVSRP